MDEVDEVPAIVEDCWAVVVGLADRLRELFHGEAARDMVEPCAWIFADSDPPEIEIVEHLVIVSLTANHKPLQWSRPRPKLPGERIVMFSYGEDNTLEFHVPLAQLCGETGTDHAASV